MEVKVGYKQTEVGVIPEEWEVKALGSLGPFVTSGSRGWAGFYSDRGSPFIRITNLSRESIYLDLTDLKSVNLPPEAKEGVRTQLQEHDVLVSITADIGIVGYVTSHVPQPAYINQHIALVRFDSSRSDGRFVAYLLASENPQKLFRASTDIGAKAGMSLVTVQKLRVAFPPLPEQRAIAAVLGDVDALLGALEKLIAKKRDLKQAAMQQLLTGRQRLPGFSGEWEVKRLSELLEFRNGANADKHAYGKGVPFINVLEVITKAHLRRSDIPGRVLLPRSSIDSFAVRRGDILFNRTSETQEEVGLASVYMDDETVVFGGFVIRGRPECACIDATYSGYAFRSPGIRSQIIAKGQGAIRANIGQAELGQVFAPLPSLAEQQAIAVVLSDMDAEIAALEARLAKTRALKQGMMQELLTGKTRLI